jgi:copper oxidase (laccase) domain-containing protein
VESGVPGARIYVAGVCTSEHPDFFCSYRRDGRHTGRMAAAIRAR